MNKKNMKKKRILAFALLLILTLGMLIMPKVSVNLALSGLNLWFTKMIPTLFPFMVVSGILIRMNLVKPLCGSISKLLHPLFGVREPGAFCIIIGFLCGFPMGAKVISDLYTRGELNRTQAEYLLSFCNNIGPIYFCGYVMALLEIENKLPYLIGMYGIPLLYGMVQARLRKPQKTMRGAQLHMAQMPEAPPESFMEAVDASIFSGIENITKLGGYMIFFNLFNLLPRMFMSLGALNRAPYQRKVFITQFLSCFFEISNGVNLVKGQKPLLILIMLPFGGLCCMAQTYSILKDTGLSMGKYGFHKVMLTVLTLVFYLILRLFSPAAASLFSAA